MVPVRALARDVRLGAFTPFAAGVHAPFHGGGAASEPEPNGMR
jgi:hypothetical protein